MTVNSYLIHRASDAVLSTNEQHSISTSISTLQTRLANFFGSDVQNHFRFGSSTRGTILPRKMDVKSDIDYMVVFSKGGYTPQTYLNQLRRFVDAHYSSSDVKQSSPSITLELDHIKFDLVPALALTWGVYHIPSGPNDWQNTSPNDFNDKLVSKNGVNHFIIKPTIRLMKFWNAENGYVYDSFLLEKWIVEQNFYLISSQRDYLFVTFDKLPVPSSSQWSRERVERAKRIVAETRQLERDGYPYLAEAEIKKLIPES